MEPNETVQVNAKDNNKVLVKGLIIAFIILILQVPAFYVSNLIEEREGRQREAIEEVSRKWAGKQNITGPVVVLPYWELQSDTAARKIRVKQYAYFFPDELNINTTATPQERYRGIYKVTLFNAKASLNGTFAEIKPEKLGIAPEDVLWKEAFVQLNVSDAKGLNDEVILDWNNRKIPLAAQTTGENRGLNARLDINGAEELTNIRFSTSLNLNGSQQMLFTPAGKITTVTMNSPWPHPSFIGDILPQNTLVKESGFSAQWKSLAFKRNFPQQWKSAGLVLDTSEDRSSIANAIQRASFGTDFFIPVNAYQKTTRSVKYAFLCIVLTFAFFFLVDTANKKNVHPFQYGLIGVALILFYTLLLSFSEYIGFNLSYLVATIFTISLIAWFIKGVLDSSRLAAILSVVLILTYSYVFTILQLQDYALLLGSLGLFLTLAVIMYFSRKVKW